MNTNLGPGPAHRRGTSGESASNGGSSTRAWWGRASRACTLTRMPPETPGFHDPAPELCQRLEAAIRRRGPFTLPLDWVTS
jgi:hypothetical protein